MENLIGSYRTKSGAKYHRCTCRFAKTATQITASDPSTRKLMPCAVCKPHLPESMLPKKSVGPEVFGACQMCCKGLHKDMTREELAGTGYKLTKTGTKYHAPHCRLVGGTGKAKPKVIKPIPTKDVTVHDGAFAVA